MAYKNIKHVSYQIWSQKIIENRVMGQRNWIIFCYVICENELVGILLPANMAAQI